MSHISGLVVLTAKATKLRRKFAAIGRHAPGPRNGNFGCWPFSPGAYVVPVNMNVNFWQHA